MTAIDFDDAFARARTGHTFSNNTEFDEWAARWCARCQREAPFRSGLTPFACPLPFVARLGRVPAEWLEQPTHAPADRFHCIEFRPPGGGTGPPRPKPDPQDTALFPRPQRNRRMLTQSTHEGVTHHERQH